MGRTPRRAEPVTNSLVASAARISTANFKNYLRAAKAQTWHVDAWNFYHTIGEFRYSVDWVGSMVSKALLFATKKDGRKHVATDDQKAVGAMEDLFGDDDGRAEMLRLMGIHLTITGECWVVGYPNPDKYDADADVWQVLSAGALNRGPGKDSKWTINNIPIDANPDDVLVFRVWRQDPERPELAISPSQAALPILGEIFKLTEHVAAQVDSRLAGAGILLMPSEMTFPAPPEVEGQQTRTASNAEDLMKVITEAMATSIENRSDASALVPIVITAPADAIAAVKHLTFWSELDKQAIDLRNEAIRRLALSMDMPPEVLQGLSDSNHWSAWQADESAIKAHTEPLLKIITTALAKGYLRPALDELGVPVEQLRDYAIGVDTSEMRLRPNRSKEALELYDRGQLNGVALRRETGFDEEDAMTEDDLKAFFIQKVASGSTTPELVEAALKEMGISLNVVAREDSKETTEARPTPSLGGHPENNIPDQEVSGRRKEARERGDVPSAIGHASLIAACDQVVIRALERAGNRLKNRMQTKPLVAAAHIYRTIPVKTDEVEFLLDDAWGPVPEIASRYNLDPQWLVASLHDYCKGLLEGQEEHAYADFERAMLMQLDNERELAA